MADHYEVVKGSLKLKGVADGGVKKKKKKKKNKALEEAAKIEKSKEQKANNSSGEEFDDTEKDTRTEAQKTFDRIQEKRAADRILKKASKTHRQRVEKFNEYLDDLTEHYDIPKVSWTK